MIIIQDTREKIPWNFSELEECEQQIIKKLNTGDYTIAGYEDVIIIDRKKSISELYSNLCRDYNRFRKELKRMQSFKYAYFLLEFSLDDLFNYSFYKNCNSKSLLEQISTIENKYKVNFIFCRNRSEAQEKALELFKEAINGTTSKN